MKLSRVEDTMLVNVSKDKAWSVLARFVDVGAFHPGVLDSQSIGSKSTGVGADRHCRLPKNVEVWERITEWNEGDSYTYEVYQWKKFPLKKMLATFGVRAGRTAQEASIYQIVDYRLSPGFLTGIMRGQLKTAVRDTLLGYKHFMETGEANVDLKKLRKIYRRV